MSTSRKGVSSAVAHLAELLGTHDRATEEPKGGVAVLERDGRHWTYEMAPEDMGCLIADPPAWTVLTAPASLRSAREGMGAPSTGEPVLRPEEQEKHQQEKKAEKQERREKREKREKPIAARQRTEKRVGAKRYFGETSGERRQARGQEKGVASGDGRTGIDMRWAMPVSVGPADPSGDLAGSGPSGARRWTYEDATQQVVTAGSIGGGDPSVVRFPRRLTPQMGAPASRRAMHAHDRDTLLDLPAIEHLLAGDARESSRGGATIADLRSRLLARRADEERRARRRRRLRRVGVGAIGVSVVLSVGALFSPLFGVAEVHVIGGAHLGAEQVRDASGLEKGKPLVLLSLPAIERKVAGLPWVEFAEARRRWPRTVEIRIRERTPVAAAPALGARSGSLSWMLLDATGTVLERSSMRPSSALLVDVGAPRATPAPPPAAFAAVLAAEVATRGVGGEVLGAETGAFAARGVELAYALGAPQQAPSSVRPGDAARFGAVALAGSPGTVVGAELAPGLAVAAATPSELAARVERIRVLSTDRPIAPGPQGPRGMEGTEGTAAPLAGVELWLYRDLADVPGAEVAGPDVARPGRTAGRRSPPLLIVRFGLARDLPAKFRALETVLRQVDNDRISVLDLAVPEAPVLTGART